MSCRQIAKVHEKRRANLCSTGCLCSKKRTFQRHPLTFDTLSQINEDTLSRTDIQAIIESLVLVKNVMFDNNELICNVDDDELVPRLLALGAVTHTGGELTGTFKFTSSGAFAGRLGAFVNGQYASTEFTFSAVAGVNEFDFNFGTVGKADVQFSLFNDGIPATTDFIPANVASTVANVSVSAITNGFKITTTGVISNGVDYVTFNVGAEAGKWLQIVNSGGSPATTMVNNTTNTAIVQRNPSSSPTTTNYSIGSGLGQSKTGIQISFRTAGGTLASGADIDFIFTNTERIAVDITDASIRID